MSDGSSGGSSPKDSGSPEGQGLSAARLYALSNAIRREILRQLHKVGDARSAVGLGETMEVKGTTISYHLKVLQRNDLVRLEDERSGRGFPEKFFVSTAASNKQIVAILAETEKEDHAACR